MQISLQHKCSTDYEYNWILQVLSRLFPLVPAGSTKKSPFSVLREHPIHVVNLHDNFFQITFHDKTVLEAQVLEHIEDVGLVVVLPNLNDTCSLVLKVVNAAAINDENMRRHSHILRKICSPHLPKFLGYYQDVERKLRVSVWEYVGGMNLQEFAQVGSFSDRLNVFLQLLKAIKDLLDQKYFVGDIHPENFRVKTKNGTPHVYIVDLDDIQMIKPDEVHESIVQMLQHMDSCRTTTSFYPIEALGKKSSSASLQALGVLGAWFVGGLEFEGVHSQEYFVEQIRNLNIETDIKDFFIKLVEGRYKSVGDAYQDFIKIVNQQDLTQNRGRISRNIFSGIVRCIEKIRLKLSITHNLKSDNSRNKHFKNPENFVCDILSRLQAGKKISKKDFENFRRSFRLFMEYGVVKDEVLRQLLDCCQIHGFQLIFATLYTDERALRNLLASQVFVNHTQEIIQTYIEEKNDIPFLTRLVDLMDENTFAKFIQKVISSNPETFLAILTVLISGEHKNEFFSRLSNPLLADISNEFSKLSSARYSLIYRRTLNVLSQLVTNYLDWSHEREIQVLESFAALWFSSLYLSVNEFNDPYTFEDLTAPIPMLSEGFRNNLLSQIDHTQLLNLVIQAEEEAKNNTVLRERIQKFRKFLEDHYSKQDFN